MPGIALHFVLADRVLDAWRSPGASPPFDPHDREALNAFHHGAVGPDLGYFPGGARCLSDLSHCLRPATLSRALVRTARTERERAFAWGWVTHVLADQAIHPWIGRGVGEVLHGDRDRFVDGSSDLLSHLRVEMGVDAWYAARHPGVRRRRLRPAFGAPGIRFLRRAYAATYGVELPEALFRRSHEAAGRRVGQALLTLGLVHGLMAGELAPPVLPGVGRALRALYRCGVLRNVTMAYLTPIRPAPWLLDGIEGERDRHTGRFLECFASGADDLEELNLDTGRPVEGEAAHAGTRRARAALADRSAPTALPGLAGPLGLGAPRRVPSEG